MKAIKKKLNENGGTTGKDKKNSGSEGDEIVFDDINFLLEITSV